MIDTDKIRARLATIKNRWSSGDLGIALECNKILLAEIERLRIELDGVQREKGVLDAAIRRLVPIVDSRNKVISTLVTALKAAEDYLDTEYFDGSPGDSRLKWGDVPALDNLVLQIREAIESANLGTGR